MPRCFFYFYLLIALLGLGRESLGQSKQSQIEFKAKYYERDLKENIVRANGDAWVRKGTKQIWADRIDIDFDKDVAIAEGNVRILDGEMYIWCSHATYHMSTDDAVLEMATVAQGQMVFSGDVIRRMPNRYFEIENGSYSNCNVEMKRNAELRACLYDWNVSGRFFTIQVEGYVHVYDAVVQIKKLPVFYSPYFVAPVKTERQSGFLLPSLSFTPNLGTGFRLPYFWSIAPWQDLTIVPTQYSKNGYHLGLNYRYVYSDRIKGNADLFLLQRRFGSNRDNPGQDDGSRPRTLGVFGEWAVNLRNIYFLPGRSHTKQTVRFVSHPFYTFDYQEDLGVGESSPSLRSRISYTRPDDKTLFTADLLHHQNLVVSRDDGVDRGSVTRLPQLSFSRSSTPFLADFFAFEVHTELANFFRPGPSVDAAPANYVREGQRVRVEPRLVANVPMPPGFQLQPVLKGGSLVYRFDSPQSQFIHREYSELEVPMSIYLARRFDTSISGFEQLSHVVQPRVVYGASLYQREPEDHPFFQTNSAGLRNPRFDILDEATEFEFMRFELLNRFRRKLADGTVERFLLVQLSQQYNSVISDHDPRFARRLGPIEVLSELEVGNIKAQLDATVQLEKSQRDTNTFIRESDWSASLDYQDNDSRDRISLRTKLTTRADDSQSDKLAYLDFYKTLPFFFDLEGSIEYTFKETRIRSYALALHFASKPFSCWTFSVLFGQNSREQIFTRFHFSLAFGAI